MNSDGIYNGIIQYVQYIMLLGQSKETNLTILFVQLKKSLEYVEKEYLLKKLL